MSLSYGPSYDVTFAVAGQRVALYCNKRLPWERGYSHTAMQVKGVQLVEDVRAWQGACEDLKKDYATARETLEAMLKAQPTYERLEKDWPEGRAFYKSLPVDFPYQHQVPAVQVKALNAMLGLA